MATLAIDELNTPKEYSVRSIPYEKYFGEMELSDKQIKQRIEFAKEKALKPNREVVKTHNRQSEGTDVNKTQNKQS